MPSIETKLVRLRNWFVAYYVVASALANVVTLRILDGMGEVFPPGHGGDLGRAGSMALAVVVELGVLALFLWFFHALLRLRNWARVVLLVFGWLGLASAVLSLLGAGCLGAAGRSLPGCDLGGLSALSLATNVLRLGK